MRKSINTTIINQTQIDNQATSIQVNSPDQMASIAQRLTKSNILNKK